MATNMNYTKCIMSAIDFIEDHLFEDIPPVKVASNIGFSEYHFHRVFQGMLGESVAAYIRKRRLSEMAILLKNSDKSIFDVSSISGFESHEAFTRAFKKMYGVSPIQYKKKAQLSAIHDKTRFTESMIEHLQKGITLNPYFETRGPELVVGMADSYSAGSSFTGVRQLWKSFVKRKNEISDIKQGYSLGVCLAEHPNFPKSAEQTFIYMAGLPVNKVSQIPRGMDYCEIPKAKYAIFTHKGSLQRLPETINYVWGTWIPKNIEQHRHANMPDFELYDSRFDPRTESGEFDIYIPIEHD
jgi:AraC family transcriptional regulator